MTIQEAIRKLRKAYQETQQYFASRLKMSISSLAYYEVGIRHPDLTALLKFSRAAEDMGRQDLVKVFAEQVHADLGRFVIQADDELQYQQLLRVREILIVNSVDAANEHYAHLGEKLMELLDMVDQPKPKSTKRKDKK